jgi:hypothetical protein
MNAMVEKMMARRRSPTAIEGKSLRPARLFIASLMA